MIVESSGTGDGASIMGLEDGKEMGKRDRRERKRWWCKREVKEETPKKD